MVGVPGQQEKRVFDVQLHDRGLELLADAQATSQARPLYFILYALCFMQATSQARPSSLVKYKV